MPSYASRIVIGLAGLAGSMLVGGCHDDDDRPPPQQATYNDPPPQRHYDDNPPPRRDRDDDGDVEERPRYEAEIVVQTAPPREREEYPPRGRPGCVWVRGHWYWHNHWDWVPGYWVRRHREDDVWVSARWDFFGGSWHFRAGHWR